MFKLSMCRICLVEDVRMHSIADTYLQEIYEKLTATPLETKDCRPLHVCYICRARLQNCHQLHVSCLQSEEFFAKILGTNFLNQFPVRGENSLKIVHPVMTISSEPMYSQHDNEDPNVIVEPLNTTSIQVKVETVEAIEEKATAEENPEYIRSQCIVKSEKVSAEDNFASETVKINIQVKKEEDGLLYRNYHHIRENDIKTNDNTPSVGSRDKMVQKRVKTSLKKSDLRLMKITTKKSKLAVAKEKNQNTTSKKFETKMKLEKKYHTRIMSTRDQDIGKKTVIDNANKLSIYTEGKPFKCDLCEKSFSQKRYYDCHKRMHSDDKAFRCDVCEKGFYEKSKLIRHIRIHTGEKPYKCNVCERRFRDGSDFLKHTRIHTGEKPYKCNVCERRFRDGSDFLKHTRIHTGEKPYKCDICDRGFIQKQHLTIHTRKHTGE